MAGSYARTVVVGNVGRDPEMRYTPSGAAVTNFSVAVSRRYQRDGEWTEETTWYNVVAWNKLAESANAILAKGRKVLVEGEMRCRKWEKDGQKRESWELLANTFVALDKKPQAQDAGGDDEGDDDGEAL